MEKELTMFFYLVYALIIVLLGVMWYANYASVQAGEGSPLALFDPQTKAGMAIQYCVILYTLCIIPGALYWFKSKCRRLSEMEEGYEKYRQYYMYARLRASAIASAMLFSVLAYILMGGYQPMMWLAAIAAVAFVFCKPNPRKTEEDLSKKDPDSTY